MAGGECEECGRKKRLGLQAKLKINEPGDIHEREADRIADQVMETPVHPSVNGVPTRIQRLSEQSSGLDAVPASVDQALAGPGRPLEPALRQNMEQRFGYDFSRVRVHTGVAAEQSARDVNAHAYTVSQDVVFGMGRFAPGMHEGRRLIAHELTHVVQQTAPAAGVLQRSPDDEKEKAEEKPTTKLVGCNKDQQSKIEEAIKQAVSLASRAVQAFERDIPLSFEMKAMKAHFGSLGSDQKSTIIERYKHIQANSGRKAYTCAKKGKKVKEGKEVVDLCGQASCPGSKMTLFPDFGKEECPAGPVVLHEVAHNAGACDDIDKGKNYPPASSEDNGYSYEYFATDIAAGLKAPPELKKRKPKAPEIED